MRRLRIGVLFFVLFCASLVGCNSTSSTLTTTMDSQTSTSVTTTTSQNPLTTTSNTQTTLSTTTSSSTQASTITQDDFVFQYLASSHQYQLIGYTGQQSVLIVPSLVQGIPVVSIKATTFQNNATITQLTISSGIEIIDEYAFRNMANLQVIMIPNSVGLIGKGIFAQCPKLSSITVPFIGQQEHASAGTKEALFSYWFTAVTYANSILIRQYADSGDIMTTYMPSSLVQVTITKATHLKKGVFRRVSMIQTLDLGNVVKGIEPQALMDCYQLTTLLQTNAIESIAGYSLDDTQWYQNQPEGFVVVGKVLYRYKGSVPQHLNVFPSGLVMIGDFAFEYQPTLETLVLPEGIQVIGKGAFQSASSLRSVSLPSSLLMIDDHAFASNSSLETIQFPPLLQSIGQYAFFENRVLEGTVTLPSSLQFLGEGAFMSCYKVKEYIIPATLHAIGHLAFHRSFDLIRFIVDANNPHYQSLEGVLYSKDGTRLIQYPANGELLTFVIPASVQTIEEGAFSNAQNLEHITMNDHVVSIGEYTFAFASALRTIQLSNALVEIPSFAFLYATKLESITLPTSTQIVHAYAFEHCHALTTVYLNKHLQDVSPYSFDGSFAIEMYSVDTENITYQSVDGVVYTKSNQTLVIYPAGSSNLTYSVLSQTTAIGYRSFLGAKHLEVIIIPDTVKIIEDKAFYHAVALKTVTMGHGVESILGNAFEGCINLTTIHFSNQLKTIEAGAFRYNSSIIGIILPSGLLSIGPYAFDGNSALIRIDIPSSVQVILDYAFHGCTELSIYLAHSSIPATFAANWNHLDSYSGVIITTYLNASS